MTNDFCVQGGSDSGFSVERLRNADELIERYIKQGILPGAVTLVSRRGKIVHLKAAGWSNIEKREPMREDGLFRIFSMTKMVATVAVMLLYEKGLIDLNDAVSKYIPAFAKPQVKLADDSLVPANREITIYDLLRHCGGIVYGEDAIALIRENVETLESMALKVAAAPLGSQPGTTWKYGKSTDMLSRVVEVVSGQAFDEFLKEKIFKPLDMPDTSFWVPTEKASRLTMAYNYDEKGELSLYDGNGPDALFSRKPTYLSGGAGLVSTTRDYYRFASMLLNGGRLGDVTLLSRKTVELMTLDHLPPEHPNLSIGTQCFRFGLGVSVVTDVARTRCLSSLGDFGWGGMLGTQVWMNPEEEMVVMIMIQVRAGVPTGIMDIYKRMVYQALVKG